MGYLFRALKDPHYKGPDLSGQFGHYEPEERSGFGRAFYPFYVKEHVQPKRYHVIVCWRDLTGYWRSSMLINNGSYLHYHKAEGFYQGKSVDSLTPWVRDKIPSLKPDGYGGFEDDSKIITVPFYKIFPPGTRVKIGTGDLPAKPG